MTDLAEEANSATGQKIRELYYDILNCKGTRGSYEEEGNEDLERKHSKKLDKKRAKALRKQNKKLKAQDDKFMKGEDLSDDDMPFWMQDASIRAAMKAKEFAAQEEALRAKKEAKKRKRKASSSSDEDSDSDSDSPSSSSSDKKKKKKKDKKDKKSKSEEADDVDVNAMFGDKKKKKKSKENGDAAKEPDEPDPGEKKKKKKSKPVPVICLVVDVQPVPKKDKLRLCKVRVGDEDPIDVVTNAPNVCKGSKFILALPGTTVATGLEVEVGLVGGVESCGMLCGPKEMGWDTDILDEKMAVMLGEEAEIGEKHPSYEEAVEVFQARKKAEEAKAAAAAQASKGKKGKKGGKAAADEEDLDALLDEFDIKVDDTAAAGGKKNKKKGKAAAKKAEDDDDFAAALEEVKQKEAPKKEEEEAPKEEEASKEEEAPKGKKKDKKKKGGAADDEEDLDAILAEEAPPEAQKPVEEEKPAEAETPTAEAAGEDEKTLDAKTLANRRKKDKKKAKQAVGGEGMWGGAATEEKPAADGAEAAPEAKEEPAPAPKAAGKKGGKPEKKESAVVKAAREKMEAQKKLDEEQRLFEEAERKRIAEEERIEREEQEALEAARQKKRDAKKAKIDKMKAEGTWLTAKQKLQQQRAAQLREQFGFDINAQDEEGEEKADGEAKKPAKRPLATKKKKQPKREEAEKAEEKKDEEAKAEPEAVKEEVKPAKEEKAEDEEDEDGWEAKADEDEEETKAADDEEEEGDDDSSSDSDSDSDKSSDFLGYRSPIVCIMGHVDTGKTKLLDKIRRTNVQEGEAGGITQQIGATFFPDIALNEQTKKVDEDFEIEVPGLLIIDTPGHESFNNLRKRGSSLCDLAILVIDIMHGLEPQTVESLEMLKKRRCPFIIALNKCDVCYGWKSEHYTDIRSALARQDESTRQEFQTRKDNVMLQLMERGLNCGLYWENEDYRSTVSVVPTSALTGEGVPDLLFMLLTLSQELMASSLEVEEELQCTVIEVKNIEGHGTTIDVVLVNGKLRKGDQIVLAGMYGPIVTHIRSLLTPHPMKEMRVNGDYMQHAEINTSMGVKIAAPELESAVAGTELKVVGPEDDVEDLKDEVQGSFDSIISDIDKQSAGVYVKASTLGSLEALLTFLQDMKIPVFEVGIGEVHKKDVKRALIMKEKSHPEYAVILAFDVNVSKEATEHAKSEGVQIMVADIIYHLFDRFTQYMNKVNEAKKQEVKLEAVFPTILQIDKNCVFHKRDPMILGVDVMGGQLRIGTPICVPDKDFIEIGRIGSIEKDRKPVQIARRGERVCIKIDQNTQQAQIQIGRHFEISSQLYSAISRSSIDTLKEHFKEEMKKEDWQLIIGMKQLFGIS
mmetsp:Transcript_115639/g.210316  ORF Transcript_115639/g.210316 Transcript_115639/m.210316 type:complete len:1357 (-) Transcript_115639:347-4417(-)